MKFTKWFNFKKPDSLDTVNINDLNDSFDMIDEKLKSTTDENKNLLNMFKNLIINAGNSNAEVAASRGNFDYLPDRLNNFDSSLEKIDNEVKKPLSLNKCDEEMLGAIQNKEGETTFNLLSIPRDGSVDYEKTNFLELDKNINLYNNKDYITGCRLQDITGGNGFFKTELNVGKIGYLEVKSNTKYSIKKEGNTLVSGTSFTYATDSRLYNKEQGNMVVDGLFVIRNNSTFATFTTTETDRYLYIFFDDDINAECYIQVLEGEITEFVAKKIAYAPNEILNIYSKNEVFNKEELLNIQELNKDTEISYNLFNWEDIEIKGKYIDSTGNYVSNDNYSISKPIKFEPNTKYSATPLGTNMEGIGTVALYDKNDTFITRKSISSSINYFTTPINVAYGRCSVGKNGRFAVLNKGDKLLDYKPSGGYIDSPLNRSYITSISKSKQSNKMNDYLLSPFCEDKYYSSNIELPYSTLDNVDINKLYGYWDLLIEDNYCSKTLLGKDTSEIFDIYKYKFSSTLPTSELTIKKPKILIATPHSVERPILLALLNMFALIKNNWRENSILEFLRWNIDFEIIPVANPWGYENKQRGTVNHVDINRNFDFYWSSQGSTDQTDDRYRGTSPHSEKETQYIVNMLNENKDSIAVLDLHTWGTGSPTWNKVCCFGVPTFVDNTLMMEVATYVLTSLTISGQKHLNIPLDSGFVGEIIGKDYNNLATLSNYATSLGFNTITPEGGYKYVGGLEYTDDINKFNVEFVMNTVLSIIKTYLYN